LAELLKIHERFEVPVKETTNYSSLKQGSCQLSLPSLRGRLMSSNQCTTHITEVETFNNHRLGLRAGCTGQSPWARAWPAVAWAKRQPCDDSTDRGKCSSI